MPDGYNLPITENPSSLAAGNPDLLAPIENEATTSPRAGLPEKAKADSHETALPEAGAFGEFKEAAMEALEQHSANLESIDQRERQLAADEAEAQQEFEQRRLALLDEIDKVIKPGQEQLSQLAEQMNNMLEKFPETKPGQPEYVQLSFLGVDVRATADMLEIGKADIEVRTRDIGQRLTDDVLEKKHTANSITNFEDYKNSKYNSVKAGKSDPQNLKAA